MIVSGLIVVYYALFVSCAKDNNPIHSADGCVGFSVFRTKLVHCRTCGVVRSCGSLVGFKEVMNFQETKYHYCATRCNCVWCIEM